MSNNNDDDAKPAGSKKCSVLPEHPNMVGGWGCCMCRVFNGHQRNECKNCGHKRCDHNPSNQPS